MSTRKAIGIDLGTTFSAVAHIDAYGKPQIIPNSESERITPSVILFEGESVTIGTHAKNNSVAERSGLLISSSGNGKTEGAVSPRVQRQDFLR